MPLTRRAFLQRTSLLLTGLGLYSPQQYQALADTTTRKLALLVGIDQYTSAAKLPNLKGCLTDLDLHRELLIHRFGFQPTDIVELRNQEATLSNLETAFVEHLLRQARPRDVVVFHFSGYGRQVQVNPSLMDRVDVLPDAPLNALIPFDAVDSDKQLNALLQRDLSLLLRSLPTDQIISVLDIGLTHPDTDILGHLRVRSLPSLSLTANELRTLSVQDDILAQLSPGEQLKQLVQRSQRLPGLALSAADANQTAVEIQWHNYAAGLFTAALTRELWQATPASTLDYPISRTVTDIAQPMGDAQLPYVKPSRSKQAPFYTAPQGPTAEGVVMQDNQVWLGGIDPHLLEQYQPQTCFRLLSEPEPSAAAPSAAVASPLASQPQRVYLGNRSGFATKAELEQSKTAAPLQAGQLLQESVRVVPTMLELNVALGKALDRVERVDATSAFSDLDHMSPVTTNDQPADYLFTKITATAPQPEDEAEPTTQASYGLCLLGGMPLPGSTGEPDEAIKTAIRRLHPFLKTALAVKLLELTVNASASRVGAIATLETVNADQSQSVMAQYTPRAPWTASGLANTVPDSSIVSLAEGDQLRYQIRNYSSLPLYWLLLGVNGTRAFVCYAADRPEGMTSIAPGTTLTVPPEDNKWKLHGPQGFCTTYLIVSRQPLTETITLLQEQLERPSPGEVVSISELLDVARKLLQDIDGISTAAAQAAGIDAGDGWALDMNQWATFKFFHQVV